ncbi:MAG: HEAT repeat domain-containing protein [Planctomycetaceae bacterium]|nr:HEAT repeat domain-containing protein [Planctomycetaceae bacterium]
MWLGNTKLLWVAGMGLVIGASGCARLTGGPRLLEPEERQRLNEGYGTHEVRKPVIVVDGPDLSYFDERDMAADALGRIGADSIPDLQLALKSPDVKVRQYACRALAQAGPSAAPAVTDLSAALDDVDPDVRRLAARALGQIGPAAKDAIPALIRVIGDGKSPVPTPGAPRLDIQPEIKQDDTSIARQRSGRFV